MSSVDRFDRFDRFERELPGALLDVAGTPATDYLTDILGRTARTRQRPAWASLERWLPMDLATPRAATARVPWRTIGVLALVALLLVVLVAVYAGSQRRVPAPFGPAANGLIPFEADGDILLGDPVTGETRLLRGGSPTDYGPTFSPDGTLVGFLRASADCPIPGDVCPGGEDIVVVGADGSGERTVTASPVVGLGAVAWMPDTKAFVAAVADGDSQRLLALPIDGSAPREIATGLTADWIEFRPPSGDEMLLRASVDGQWGIWTIRPDGSGLRLLAAAQSVGDPGQDLNFVSYSPDGSRIHYNRYTPEHETIEAWVMDADGSNQRRFNADEGVTGWWEGEMAPSPDGRWVAMWRVPPANPVEITLYPADGTGTGRVIGPDVRGTALWTWSPDSSRLLVTYNDPSEGYQVLVDPATGQSTDPAWQAHTEPDWQRLTR